MLLTILSYFQEFIPQMRNTFIFSFIFLLLFSFIFPISIFPISSHKDTLPVKSNQNLQTKFIKENTNKYFISTKDGYLHALNNNKKEIWKAYLEQELMSSTLSTRKIKKDLFLYPMNERLYIYKNGEFIDFQIFIKDLAKKPFLRVDSFSLMGEMKTTLYVIDVDTGEILKKIDNKNNFFNKRYILSKNTMIVVRIDYILSCRGLDEDQNYWNASFSDIEIYNGNGNDNSDISKFFISNLREIINEYKSNNDNDDISIDNIINAYSYFNQDIAPVKIYDITYSNNELEGEIKQLAQYNNDIKNKFGENDINNELETKLKYLEHFNKDNNKMEFNEQMKLPNYLGDENCKMKLPNYSGDENIKYNHNLNNNVKNNDYLKTKIKSIIHFFNNYIILILVGIIIILSIKLKYYKYFSYTLKKENEQKDKILCEKEKQIKQKSINNNNIIIDNNDDNKNDILIDKINENKIFEKKRKHGNNSVLLKHKTNFENIHIKKYSYDVTQKRATGHSDTKKFKIKNVKKEEKKEISINSKNEAVDNNVNEEKTIEKEDEENNNEIIINSNNNSQNKKDEKDNSIAYKDTNGIWDDDDDDNNNDNKSGNNSEENENESNEDEKKILIEKNENSQKIEKSIEKSEVKIEKKSKNESCDEDEEEEEEEEEDEDSKDDKQNVKEDTKKKENSKSIMKNSKNSSSFISNDNSKSYEHMETNEETYPKNSENIIENKKEKKQSRLDTDFDNLEKIGQGGFGVVLKGRHKIDQDIYAIKIIDITNNSKECDEIVSEAKKMKAIKGEYIVNYTICWYDDNLGSAEKFFEKQEKSDSSSQYYSNTILSRSVRIQFTKKDSKFIELNDNKDIYNIQEIDEDKYDDNNNELINNCKCPSKEKTDSINSTNNNNSLEILENNNKNQIYNNRSKYCFEYMDDSKLMNKSIISRKFDEEINQKKQKKYFFILMEYCDGLTLEIFITQHSNKSIERKIIYNYTRQILKALKKLHKNGIIHRDIKPGNIFIKNEQIKIGDFGLATQVKTNAILQTKDLRGFTPTYAAPEQTNSKTYNEKVDIYACGITLFEMCGCFGTEMERQLALKDLKSKRIVLDRIIKNYPEESKLIKLMTERDYNERPSAEQILKSELFAELGKIVN